MPRQADVTVLLPAYNAAPYVAEAVESILRQTYPHFTLLAMDDGSTDGTGEILDRLAIKDSRIRVVHRENRGLVPTLNEGLTLCETELVARMDADDYSMPDRLRIQRNYIEAHPEIAACGTSMEEYESGRRVPVPTDVPFEVAVIFRATFPHATGLFRRSALLSLGGYNPAMVAAEDYDLWTRMLEAGYAMVTLPQVLYRWRTHPGVPRVAYRHAMRCSLNRIWTRQLMRIGISPTREELDLHAYCSDPCRDVPWKQRQAEKWLLRICETNRRSEIHDQNLLEQECRRILSDFPLPLSLQECPLRYAARMLRHRIMTLCRACGLVGARFELVLRSLMIFVRSRIKK